MHVQCHWNGIMAALCGNRRRSRAACHAQHKRCAATAASRHLNYHAAARLLSCARASDMQGSQPTATARHAHHLVVRRGQPARSTSLRTATKSGCPNVQTGCAQQSADEETCAGHTLAADAATTRQRDQTAIKKGLKRVPPRRVDSPRRRVDKI